jgi:hypothetical protein
MFVHLITSEKPRQTVREYGQYPCLGIRGNCIYLFLNNHQGVALEGARTQVTIGRLYDLNLDECYVYEHKVMLSNS